MDKYSQAVSVVKIALPLLALGILSTLFLYSAAINPNDAIPFAETDVESIAKEQRIGDATYATVGSGGAAIRFWSSKTTPDADGKDAINAKDIKGKIEFPDGETVDLSAALASVDFSKNEAALSGSVELTSSLGFNVVANSLVSELDRALIRSGEPVAVSTPFGTMDAGGLQIGKVGDTFRMVFNNKVKLLYVPG